MSCKDCKYHCMIGGKSYCYKSEMVKVTSDDKVRVNLKEINPDEDNSCKYIEPATNSNKEEVNVVEYGIQMQHSIITQGYDEHKKPYKEVYPEWIDPMMVRSYFHPFIEFGLNNSSGFDMREMKEPRVVNTYPYNNIKKYHKWAEIYKQQYIKYLINRGFKVDGYGMMS